MKKFYIYNESANERNAVYFDFENGRFSDILGVEFILETAGDAITSEDLDVSLDELMERAATEVISLVEEDVDYIMGLCESWGLL